MSSFRGRVALITGGASGIGAALARQLASAGAVLSLADIQDAEPLAQELRRSGASVSAHRVDVRDFAAVQAWVDSMVESHGRIDLIFNNAGVAVYGDATHFSHASWELTVDVNIKGVIYGIEAALPHMLKAGSGHIVNTASLAGLVPVPGMAAYVASKHAVVGLSESLYYELKPRGICVTAICPGFIRTPLAAQPRLSKGIDAEQHAQAIARIPMASPETAARDILAGVSRRQRRVMLPRGWKAAYRLITSLPGGLSLFGRLFAAGGKRFHKE